MINAEFSGVVRQERHPFLEFTLFLRPSSPSPSSALVKLRNCFLKSDSTDKDMGCDEMCSKNSCRAPTFQN